MILVVLGAWSLVLLLNAASLAQERRDAVVYTMSNDPAGNAVLAFNLADGRLTAAGAFPTGGTGSGGREPDFGLGNAHALQLSEDNRLLFVVNPGSNDISVFAVRDDGLELLDRVNSGGKQPVSVAVHGDLVYVLNGGGNVGAVDNITGFRVHADGKLTEISNSTRPLSAAATAPAQIQFLPDGSVLVVTEKSTNVIDTFTVGADGRATGPIVTQADAQTPFGFDIANRNQLFISDDFNDAPGAGALSSYTIDHNDNIHLVSSVVPAHQSGACWVAVDKSGRFAFLANTVASTTSTFAINKEDGSVTLVNSFPSPSHATDLAFSHNGRFLFALAPDQTFQASPGIRVWRFNPDDGSVTPLPGVTGLPRSVDGLVAR
jgi:6-phosphogluconolactonase (cycloisomerase 2 family)